MHNLKAIDRLSWSHTPALLKKQNKTKQILAKTIFFLYLGQLNESLSPPVKQTAERDHTDSASEASSSFHDPARFGMFYSNRDIIGLTTSLVLYSHPSR